MQIRQIALLIDPLGGTNPVSLGIEQLGLQMHDSFSSDIAGPDCLLVCGPGFEKSPAGRATVRRAMEAGCPVLLDHQDSSGILRELRETGRLSEETRKDLAAFALYRCLESDARLLADLQSDCAGMPRYVVNAYERVKNLRYGENWHQRAALYRKRDGLGLNSARKLNGREMSYNNMVDAETVLEMLIDLSAYDGVPAMCPLSVIVKHANPCGVAWGERLDEAYHLSFATDPKSAFGGVIGFNQPVDVETARAIGDSFVEVLLAPGFDQEALSMLTEKKPNRRILDIGDLLQKKDELYRGYYQRSIFGGMMLQDFDIGDIKEWNVVSRRLPTDYECRALRFAWKIAKYVKSNALVYTSDRQTIGIGSGQVSRVDSARFGAEKAQEHGLDTKGTVAATDSFFPFRDGLDEAFRAGATAVIHPGGSIRDAEVIDAADEHGMAMVFTGMRHFRH